MNTKASAMSHNFSFHNALPPSEQDLAKQRSQTSAALEAITKRERHFLYIMCSVGLVSAIVLIALWQLHLIESVSAPIAAAVVVSVLGVVVGVVVGVGVSVISVVSLAMLASAAVGVAAGQFWGVSVFVGLFVTAVAVVTTAKWYYETHIATPRRRFEVALIRLAPIRQNHCPEALVMCQETHVLARYQSAVANQGRLLTEGEFAAMREWIRTQKMSKSQMDKELDELAACDALRRPLAI